MNESWIVLLAVITVIVVVAGVVVVLLLLSLTRRVNNRDQALPPAGRRRHGDGADPPPDLGSRKQIAKNQKKLFQEFINERPEILDEPKKTQFDEFRQWREERGV